MGLDPSILLRAKRAFMQRDGEALRLGLDAPPVFKTGMVAAPTYLAIDHENTVVPQGVQ